VFLIPKTVEDLVLMVPIMVEDQVAVQVPMADQMAERVVHIINSLELRDRAAS
jgi:hypothetical protein